MMNRTNSSFVLEMTTMQGRFFNHSLGTLFALADRVHGFVRKVYRDGEHLLYKCEPGQSIEEGTLVARISRVN